MSLSDVLQLAALVILPLAVFVLVLGVSGNPYVSTGFAGIVLAAELWFVGRELDLRGGDET